MIKYVPDENPRRVIARETGGRKKRTRARERKRERINLAADFSSSDFPFDFTSLSSWSSTRKPPFIQMNPPRTVRASAHARAIKGGLILTARRERREEGREGAEIYLGEPPISGLEMSCTLREKQRG